MRFPRGARYVLAAVVALTAAGLAARSPRARASIRAAVVAFRDPDRVRDTPCEPCDVLPARALPELDQPELGGDVGRVNEADLADAGVSALSSLTLPDLPIPLTPRTLRFVSYFAASEKGREAFAARFRRAGRYRGFIEQSLRDAELPEDLLWLVAVESGFEPQATSPNGAAGLFQLTPEVAARYGLGNSELQDERRSTPRSTAAAVSLLRDLMDRYHRWDLALAAYDLGQDKLDEALARLAERRGKRDAGKPVELQDLVEARLVPKETANFVPQVQAFAIVAANRGRFGLDDLDPAPPLDFGEIAVPPGTPLSLVARAAGVSVAVVRDYNPSLLRDRAPPDGGDVLVALPADKVAAALAAFPALHARESEKLAAAAASASAAAASASAAAPLASASAAPAGPPPDRFTLSSGVIVDRRPSPGPDAVIAARVEVVPRGPRAPASATFDVDPVTARPGDLAPALGRAAQAVHALVADAGEAAVEARRRAGEARRLLLSKAPYGSSWLSLGERLFPSGHALAGTVLVSPTLPLTSVAIAEPPPALAGSLRITVTVTGATERGPLGEAAERAFAGVFEGRAAVALPPKEDRVALVEAVPSSRLLFGWLAPSASEADRAALRLAVLGLAHNEVGKAAHALVSETHVAVHVRGFLDLGDRASVAAIEVVPAVLHDEADVERELGTAIAAFADKGPSQADLAAVKAQLRARLQGEEKRAGTTGEPRDAVLARIARTAERADAVTADDLRALVKRVFSPAHWVVVTTTPRG